VKGQLLFSAAEVLGGADLAGIIVRVQFDAQRRVPSQVAQPFIRP
jgi:hypothetical protein